MSGTPGARGRPAAELSTRPDKLKLRTYSQTKQALVTPEIRYWKSFKVCFFLSRGSVRIFARALAPPSSPSDLASSRSCLAWHGR